MPQNYSQKQSLYDFILSSGVPEWDKKGLVLQELENNEIFVSQKDGEIKGCLLVRPISTTEYHCSLVIAKTKEAFKELAKAFQTKFQSCEVTSALRKGKEVKYKKSIIKKVSNL